MKTKIFFYVAILSMALIASSCDDDKTEITYTGLGKIECAGHYLGQWQVEGKSCTVSIEKICEDASLVVAMDDMSTTVTAKTYNQKYILSAGKHTLKIECGEEFEGVGFNVSVGSTITVPFNIQ